MITTGSTTITLARHGRTPWHEGNRYTGSSDIGIDDVGRRQARALAAWVGHTGTDVLYASTMLRARQTAEPVAEATGLSVHADERLCELDFGDAEGRTLAELRAEDPHAIERFERDPAAHHLPGGEHPERAADRATTALREVAEQHSGRDVFVICHNTLIRLIVCRFVGIPLAAYRTALRGMEPTATTRLTLRSDATVTLEYYNRTPPASSGDRPEDEEASRAHIR